MCLVRSFGVQVLSSRTAPSHKRILQPHNSGCFLCQGLHTPLLSERGGLKVPAKQVMSKGYVHTLLGYDKGALICVCWFLSPTAKSYYNKLS